MTTKRCAVGYRPLRVFRPGFVIPAVVFGLAVISIMSIVALRTSADEQRSSRALRESAAALYAAESGLRRTIARWDTYATATMTAGDSLDLEGGWFILNPSKAKYRAVVHRVDNGVNRVFLVVVQGRGPGQLNGQRAVEAVIAQQTTNPLYRYAAFTSGNITFSGGSATDTVLSSVNSSGVSSTGMEGNILAGGTVKIDGVADGDVSTASSSWPTGNHDINGDSTRNYSPVPTYSAISCPTASYAPASSVLNASTGLPFPTNQYDPSTGILNNPGADVLLTGQTSYYFSKIAGNRKITIDPGASADTMYVSGQFTWSGGGIVNSAGKSTQLVLSACGTNTSAWTFSGTSQANMAIYAPGHALTVSGGGGLVGAIISGSLTANGGSKVTFDEALLVSSATVATRLLIPGSWTELTLY